MLLSIAWKNIWRNKLRSLIVVMAVMLGIFAGMFSSSILLGMAKQRIDAAVNNEVSFIQLHNPKFLKNKDIQFTIKSSDSIVSVIRRIAGVKAVSSREKIMGMASSPTAATGVQIIGINPSEEVKVTSLYKTICNTCGEYLNVNNNKTPVIISQKLANKLKVKLHHKIVIRFQNTDGTIVEGAFRIAGLYRTSNSVFDEMNVFVKKSDIAAISATEIKEHEIAVMLMNPDDLDKVTQIIKKKFPKLSVMTWKDISPDVGVLGDILNIYLYVVLGIILLALSFGIVNTMLMAVLERESELGMLMAIGMNKIRIFKMIMLETIFLSLTGGILGMILSGILIRLFHFKGIDLSIFSKGLEEFGYQSIIYPELNFSFYIGLSIIVIGTGILSSLYPIKKALKLNPAEAIRSD